MNEDEIDISSSSSSSACSSRSTSPTRSKHRMSTDNVQIESTLTDDHELFDLDVDSFAHQQIIKTAGEIDLDELPPVEPLDLKANLEDLDQIGRVSSITGKLVIVVSFKGKPPLDIDSVLFLRDSLPLGKIFDTFGPVVDPYYAVRFNSIDDIANRGVKVNSPVYFIPHWPAPLTNYVFYKDLLANKGSDASWKHDNEPPEEHIDFSDDEEERLFKLKRKLKSDSNESESIKRTHQSEELDISEPM
ncbi:H/ACA ribonucleoprotein complex non-core subunit NAF1 [Tetranychus urticae]|uniref:H/ACA ribonucleoprotein complex subunit n=1 Tax=Tetranychus urticae TaxID=32264 RepID=T1KWH9_TETUR|nr:H/ACA ribonucleoprotein complex non-core subunit NAF1 [Tetranychus urticae]